MMPISWMRFEIGQPHRQKRARRRQGTDENSLAGEHHRFY